MRIFNKVKHGVIDGVIDGVKHGVIYLKLGDRCFTSLTMLVLESKGSVSFTIKEVKENLLLYCLSFRHLLSMSYLNYLIYFNINKKRDAL